MEVYVQICTYGVVQNKTGDIAFHSVFGDDHEISNNALQGIKFFLFSSPNLQKVLRFYS